MRALTLLLACHSAEAAAPATAAEPTGTFDLLQSGGFVPCPTSDMAKGDLAVARISRHRVSPIPSALRGKLVYYGSSVDNFGLLGPPGLTCEASSGSSGRHLVLRKGAAGPVVGALSSASTETSGRDLAAQACGRLLPGHEALIVEAESVVGERYPREPFPRDAITRPGTGVATFHTPPGQVGAASLMDIPPGPAAAFGAIVDQSRSAGTVHVFAMSPLTASPHEAAIEEAVVTQFLRGAGPADR